MSGTHPMKLELRCRTCGTLCYRGAGRRWTHEVDPPEPHQPDVRWFGRRRARADADPAGEQGARPEPG